MALRRGAAPLSLEQPPLRVFEVSCLVNAAAIVTVPATSPGNAADRVAQFIRPADVVEVLEVKACDVRPYKSPDARGQA